MCGIRIRSRKRRKTARSPEGKLNIDGTGIALIAIGSAALEILLDRGQLDDWFGSTFICSMLAIAVMCLVTAIIWELNHKDPVIDFRLLGNRNFAIANVFFFLFSVGLFASTTLIPQILQSLYGYRAIDAGLVLGPGAGVITLLAPVGAVLVQKGIVRPKYLMFLAISFAGYSFLYYSHLNLDTDYGHWAFARALQGFGYAFFFVPLTVIAYSELRPDQNNKASSLTNFFRNWGGSFGIAFATTLAERRSNFHQARLGENLPASSTRLQETVRSLTLYLQQHGSSACGRSSKSNSNGGADVRRTSTHSGLYGLLLRDRRTHASACTSGALHPQLQDRPRCLPWPLNAGLPIFERRTQARQLSDVPCRMKRRVVQP